MSYFKLDFNFFLIFFFAAYGFDICLFFNAIF